MFYQSLCKNPANTIYFIQSQFLLYISDPAILASVVNGRVYEPCDNVTIITEIKNNNGELYQF